MNREQSKQEIYKLLKEQSIKATNPKLESIIQKISYSILMGNQNNPILKEKIKNKVIVINEYGTIFNLKFEVLYALCFDYNIIICDIKDVPQLISFFSINNDSIIYCNSEKIQAIISQQTTEQFLFHSQTEYDHLCIQKEISSFMRYITFSIRKSIYSADDKIKESFWKTNIETLFQLLIQIAYLNSKNDQKKFCIEEINEKVQDVDIKEDEFIELRCIGRGSSSEVYLIYHFIKERICALKIFFNSGNFKKLFEREHNNFLNLHHQCFPKYFGTVQLKSNKCLLIQYIQGNLLEKINEMNFTIKELIKILFKIMLIFDLIHYNKYIYRDLKPNNLIIDEDNNVFLIDFDRMIKLNSFEENEKFTNDFASKFSAPELSSGSFSNKVDIYSLGMIIHFIISNQNMSEKSKYYAKLHNLYKKCIDNDESKRPNINALISEFYIDFFPMITGIKKMKDTYKDLFESKGIFAFEDNNHEINFYALAKYQNDSATQLDIGRIFYKADIVPFDINKAIHYFSLAANQNNVDAQFNLGLIYKEGKYVTRDIKKAIHYYSLAGNANDSESLYELGLIYDEGMHVSRDINKAIHYYTLAANLNDLASQYNLSILYYEGKYIKRDINKAIYYFTQAANQNYSNAQYNLGVIYDEGKHVTRDIKKAIHYYTLAAKQDNPKAQFNLANIYESGIDVVRDINEAIHYYTLAANQNYLKAQYNLACIYDSGLYVPRDINKAIYYYTLAANQNHCSAQINLGYIYYEGKIVPKDINKSLYYLSLAAGQKDACAQYDLASIYFKGKDVQRDINKSIYYFTLAANQNDRSAQLVLGKFYLDGKYVTKNIKKGIYHITLAANNGQNNAQFIIGFLYHQGKYVKQNIEKAIHYYKEASSFNNHYAKNNLGVLYKNGFNDEVLKKTGLAIEYFKESIRQKNDKIAMFNLSHIYLYDDLTVQQNIDEAIELLIKSSIENFNPSRYLLCIALIKKFGYSFENIKQKLDKHTDNINNLALIILKLINKNKLNENTIFKKQYQIFRKIDFLYNDDFNYFFSDELKKQDETQDISSKIHLQDINNEFYLGFGNL